VEKKTERLRELWERELTEVYEKKLKFVPSEKTSESGIPVKNVYDALDVSHLEPEMPGQYPYTRGLNALGYQYAPWMIQMLHGFGTSEETKERTKFLLKEGMRGYKEKQAVVLVQVDPPTTVGMDPDDPRAFGSVGLGGVSISTMDDIDNLLKDHELTNTRFAPNTRFTCLPVLAMYVAYAEQRGYTPNQLNGQSQNDQFCRWTTTDIGGPSPDVQFKLRVELIKYAARNIPRWNHCNLSGYLFAEMCATPAQELGLVVAEAIDTIEACIEAGLHPDEFVSRFSSQVHMGMSFFEEIGKLRAWRRLWAKVMKERFKCENPKSLKYRNHVQTGGVTLTMEQPYNNITRTTLHVLASVLGGVQSLHTASYDEAIGLPCEEAVRTAIRINQIIKEETGITDVTDPLGGSYYIEAITEKVEAEAVKLIEEIEQRGGFAKCIADGWIRRLLDKQSLQWRREVDKDERVIVGLNKYRLENEEEIKPFVVQAEEAAETLAARVKAYKQDRDQDAVKKSLADIQRAMREYDAFAKAGNLMPTLIAAAKAKCTLGEMMNAIYEETGGRVYVGQYR
jgi:methylmalonyl-CoA mutase N-terminal domain/subunit